MLHLFLMELLLFSFLQVVAQDHPIVHGKSYPAIIIDDEYNHIKPGADKSKQYEVHESAGIVLDATEMDFTILKKYLGGKDPDKVFVVCNSGTYIAEFRLGDAIILDASTLKPFIGNTKFKGFQKRDTPIISIGAINDKSKSNKMKQIWSTTFTVK